MLVIASSIVDGLVTPILFVRLGGAVVLSVGLVGGLVLFVRLCVPGAFGAVALPCGVPNCSGTFLWRGGGAGLQVVACGADVRRDSARCRVSHSHQ